MVKKVLCGGLFWGGGVVFFFFSSKEEYVHLCTHVCVFANSWEGAVEGTLTNAGQGVCLLSLDKQILLGKHMTLQRKTLPC